MPEGIDWDAGPARDRPHGPVEQWLNTLTEELSMLEKAVVTLGNGIQPVLAETPEKVIDPDNRTVPGGYSDIAMRLKESVNRVRSSVNILDSYSRRLEL